MKYQHLTIEEREKIQEMLWQKSSIRSIATALGRNSSSITRELKRNLPPERKVYAPRLANAKALLKRKSRGRIERLKNERLRKYVIVHLKLRWSPEQITGRIHLDLNERISHEAIYQFIYAQIHRNGWGLLRSNCEDLRLYLRRRKKRRTPKGMRRCQKMSVSQGLSIDLRPQIVNDRMRVGDWESDTVESCDHKPGINTFVERKTGLVFLTKLRDKTSEATVLAIESRIRDLPDNVKQTATFDNGPENQRWQEIEKRTNLKCFFAHIYHSWERGTNENTNGLARDFFPKKTDFTKISNEKIQQVEDLINNRPRKRLGWRTPKEMFSVALQG